MRRRLVAKRIVASALAVIMMIGSINLTANADEVDEITTTTNEETEEATSGEDYVDEIEREEEVVEEVSIEFIEEDEQMDVIDDVVEEDFAIAIDQSLGLIDESEYIYDDGGTAWFSDYSVSYCCTDCFKYYATGKTIHLCANLKDTPGYKDIIGDSYLIDFYKGDKYENTFYGKIDGYSFLHTLDFSTYDNGEYRLCVRIIGKDGCYRCVSEAGDIRFKVLNNNIYFNKPFNSLDNSMIKQYNSLYSYLISQSPSNILSDITNSEEYSIFSSGLKEKAKEIKSEFVSDYKTIQMIKSWIVLKKIGNGKVSEWSYADDTLNEYETMQMMLAYISIPSIIYKKTECDGKITEGLVFAYVDNHWVAFRGVVDSYPEGKFDLSKYEVAASLAEYEYAPELQRGVYSEDRWYVFKNKQNTENNDIEKLEYEVIYHQSEARSMSQMVNDFRLGNEAWFWQNSIIGFDEDSNPVYSKCVREDLTELTYDYELEKIAMKRAAEIVAVYEHERPNGQKFYSAYQGYKYLTVGENIAYGYDSVEDVFLAWREDNENYNGQGHRRNMLEKNYNKIGIACAEYNGIKYWVQEFAYNSIESEYKEPLDKKAWVNIDINKMYFQHINVIVDQDKVVLQEGESKQIPNISVMLETKDLCGRTQVFALNEVPLEYYVSNSNIEINENKIYARNYGNTIINITAIWKSIGGYCEICIVVNHSEQIDPEAPPTCIADGKTEGSHCSVCGEVIRHQQIIKATGHSWNGGVITKNATCTSKGVKTYTCTKCNATKTEDIAITEHKSVKDSSVVATCTKDGKTEGSHCSVCGKVIKAQQVVKATGHEWDNGIITKEPTVLETGIKTYTCKKCGQTRTEDISKLVENKKLNVCYSTHVQSIGWQDSVKDGQLAGTVGKSKRLEAIKISLENAPYSGNIEYRTHVQSYGWKPWVKNGVLSGTSGEAKRLEAIQIRLTGELAKHYDVYYRVQAQTYGWLGWAKNGEYSGTAGFAKRLEAIQIVLVEKGSAVSGNTKINGVTLDSLGEIIASTKQTSGTAYVAKQPNISYRTHVQSFGWQSFVSNGAMSGTSGKDRD